jgi:hypothetical protein
MAASGVCSADCLHAPAVAEEPTSDPWNWLLWERPHEQLLTLVGRQRANEPLRDVERQLLLLSKHLPPASQNPESYSSLAPARMGGLWSNAMEPRCPGSACCFNPHRPHTLTHEALPQSASASQCSCPKP